MTAVQEFLQVTTESLGRRLEAHGFAREPIADDLDKVRNLYWVREAGWRNEAVRLFYYRTFPEGFHLDLGVYLPAAERKGTVGTSPMGTLLNSADLGLLVGRKKPYYFPRLFGRLRTSRAASFAEKIGRDVERSLGWFKAYEQAEYCLRKLDSGETHWGNARGDAYRALSDHLRQAIVSQTGGGR